MPTKKKFQAIQRAGKKEGAEGRSNRQGSRSVGTKAGEWAGFSFIRLIARSIVIQIAPATGEAWPRAIKVLAKFPCAPKLPSKQAAAALLVSLAHCAARFSRDLRLLLCRRLSSVLLANIHQSDPPGPSVCHCGLTFLLCKSQSSASERSTSLSKQGAQQTTYRPLDSLRNVLVGHPKHILLSIRVNFRAPSAR